MLWQRDKYVAINIGLTLIRPHKNKIIDIHFINQTNMTLSMNTN